MPNSVYEKSQTSRGDKGQAKPSASDLQPLDDIYTYVKDYARERPDVVMFACLGIGFILGWRLKPW